MTDEEYEAAERADAHNCYKETYYDDDSELRCQNCDRRLSQFQKELYACGGDIEEWKRQNPNWMNRDD